jgi:hypothetical protein
MIQTLAGFGFGLLAVPLMILVIDLQSAVIILSIVGTLSNLLQSWQLRRDIDRVIAKRFIVASIFGAPFGFMLFIWANQSVLKLVLGSSILCGVFVLAKGVRFERVSTWLDWLMGLISGVLLMATTTNGPPLVFILQARNTELKTFRATLNIVFFITGAFGVLLFFLAGKIQSSDAVMSLASIPAMAIGVMLGIFLRRFVKAESFRKLVLALLVISGLSSIFSGLVG